MTGVRQKEASASGQNRRYVTHWTDDGLLIRREGWFQWGILSCAHWLNWKCGIGMGAARDKVRVARSLESLPNISEAFRSGQVSYSKVRAPLRGQV